MNTATTLELGLSGDYAWLVALIDYERRVVVTGLGPAHIEDVALCMIPPVNVAAVLRAGGEFVLVVEEKSRAGVDKPGAVG